MQTLATVKVGKITIIVIMIIIISGMAYVVGLLLMYISDEETVFWCFTYLLSSKDHLHMVYHHTLNK